MCVSVGNQPYSTAARLFRDSDETVQIQWYECRPEALDLPVLSAVIPRIWLGSKWTGFAGEPPHDGVGEVLGADRPISWPEPKLTATGQHYCGTPDDFLMGCEYRPDLPPVGRNMDGLPFCCGVAAVGTGGAMSGGEAIAGLTPAPPAYGQTYRMQGGAVNILLFRTFHPRGQWNGLTDWTLQSPTWPVVPRTYWVLFNSFGGTWRSPDGWDGQGAETFTKTAGPGVDTLLVTWVN